MVSFDLSKAFDSVDHRLLLYKLEAYGITDKILAWTTAFLSHRQQVVISEGDTSRAIEVTSGVPQGSVYGPLLFNIYVNDALDCFRSDTFFFADDGNLATAIKHLTDCVSLSRDIQAFWDWCERWNLVINRSKSKVISFTRKKEDSIILYDYKLNGVSLERVSDLKCVGVKLHEEWKWDNHIADMVVGAERMMRFAGRVLRDAPKCTRLAAYKTLVRPRLEYASAVWDPYSVHLVNQVERVQKRAARRITGNFDFSACITGMQADLGLVPLADRRTDHRLHLFYKILNGDALINAAKFCTAPTYAGRHDHGFKVGLPQSIVGTTVGTPTLLTPSSNGIIWKKTLFCRRA